MSWPGPRTLAIGVGAVVVALMGSIAFASPAQAATYEVTSCGDAPDQTTNNAWRPSAEPLSHMVSGAGCPPTRSVPGNYPNVSSLDGLWVGDRHQAPGGASPSGAEAKWSLVAPDGTTISRLSYDRYLGKQDDDAWLPFLRDASGAVVAGETCSIPNAVWSYRCQVGQAAWGASGTVTGDEGSASFASHRDISGLSTPRLEVGIRCTASRACLNGNTLHMAWATIYASTVTIDDPVLPTVSNLSGPLADPGRAHRGTESLSFDAADSTGTKATRLYLDGRLVGASNRSCDYTFPRPCSAATRATFTLDTTGYANGAHALEVGALDAAGNERRETRAVVIDNPPPPAPPNSSGGGGEAGGSSGGDSGSSAEALAAPSLLTAAPGSLAAGLGVRSASMRAGTIDVSGSVVARATGSVTITYAVRVAGKTRRVRTRAPVRNGAFSARMRVPAVLRRARKGSLTVAYGGDSLVAAQSVRRVLRAR